jgi:hypothetical protein
VTGVQTWLFRSPLFYALPNQIFLDWLILLSLLKFQRECLSPITYLFHLLFSYSQYLILVLIQFYFSLLFPLFREYLKINQSIILKFRVMCGPKYQEYKNAMIKIHQINLKKKKKKKKKWWFYFWNPFVILF